MATAPSLAQLKQSFLDTAIEESIKLPTQAYAVGQALRFEIPNVGIAKKFRVRFNVAMTSGATAPTGVGAKAPYSLFTNVAYNDYAGISRINASPYGLKELAVVKRFGWDPSYSPMTESYADTEVWNNTITSMIGWFDVPVSASEMDPTGSLSLEVSNGKTYLVVQCNPNLVGLTSQVDTPLVGAAGASSTVNAGSIVGVTYYFWQPVAVGSGVIVPTPVLYPNLIHEVLETQDSTNIAANQDKVTTLRTGREYHRIIHTFVMDGALDTSDITNVKFLYNGNTPTMDEELQSYLSRTRDQYGRDFDPGMVYYNFTRRPWDSTKWGELQTVLSQGAGVVASNSYLSTLTEAFYNPKGTGSATGG